MNLRERIANWIYPRQQRATAPIDFIGESAFIGIGHDDSKVHLLEGSKGSPSVAMRPIAERLETLELQVVAQRTVGDGTVEEEILDDHPLAMLFDNPGLAHDTAQMLYLMGWLLPSVGEAYVLKITQRMMGLSIPVALQFLPVQNVSPIVRSGDIQGYYVIENTGRSTILEKDEVIRVWKPDPRYLYLGRGVLGTQTILADRLKFEQEHLRKHFESDAIPPMVLEAAATDTPNPYVDPDAHSRFLTAWKNAYHRRQGVRGVIPTFLPTGYKANVIDAHGGEQRVNQIHDAGLVEMLMAFGVPRSVLGQVVSGDRSSAETNKYVFDEHTISPYAHTIERAFTSQLAIDYPQPPGTKLIVRFAPFVSSDKTFDLAQEGQDLTLKVRSPQQVLRDRGQDITDAPWGEYPVGTMSETPYTGEEREPPPNPFAPGQETDADSADDDEDEEERFTTGEWQRYLRRERKYVPRFERDYREVLNLQEKAVKQELREALARQRNREDDILAALERALSNARWVAVYERTTERTRRLSFGSAARQTMAALNAGEFIFSDEMAQRLRVLGTIFQNQVNTTTLRVNARHIFAALEEGTALGEGVDALARRVQGAVGSSFSIRRHQAQGVARTEVVTASQEAQVASFGQAGVARHRWNTSRDGRVRDSHTIDGQVTNVLNGTFGLRDGVSARYPGDPTLPAEDRINCRCFLTPVFEDEL